MKYELNDRELEYINQLKEITLTDYEVKGNQIPIENFVPMVEDLLTEYHNLEEKYNDLKQEMYNNYKPGESDPYELYISRSEFC